VRFGIYVPVAGEYDVATVAALAGEAEELGWDGVFVWDNILATFDGTGILADTTVALTAIALATKRIHFGPLVTPLTRRRPWKVAKEMSTLDRLSGGRLVFGAGLGGTWDFAPFDEAPPGTERAVALDEALDVITALWSGDDVHYRGRHYTVDGARMLPSPIQRPRIPIWTAGYWPGAGPFRRAARWDGMAPLRKGHQFAGLSPNEVADCLAYVQNFRRSEAHFDVVAFQTQPDQHGRVPEYEEAGATWWLESTNPVSERLAEFRARVRAGPPK
jgi:alkanesulfonate monooxygenase SsuD/methylene tetrahydromethanopterin reductase-like flavin-dependent oxidoreductase (luciferase family)